MNTDNKRYQEEIKRSFRHPESAKLFGFLVRYGSLKFDEIAALFRQIPSRDACKDYLEELRDCGYLITNGNSSTNSRVYRLADKAFLDPKKHRRKPNDADREKLIEMVTGIKKNSSQRGTRLRQRKRMMGTTKGKNSHRRKKRRKKVSMPTPDIFQMADIVGNIMEYLDAKIILTMATVSKIMCAGLTHEHAMRCAMKTPRGSRRMRDLENLMHQESIYTPSSMRILRLAMGRRCERCNRTKTSNMNKLGLFLCKSCTIAIVAEVKQQAEMTQEEKSRVTAAIHQERCAKLLKKAKDTFRYYAYVGRTPFLDRVGEKVGPLISLTNVYSPLRPDTTMDEIFAEACAGDPHRAKLPWILKLRDQFTPIVPKYEHQGIVDHSRPSNPNAAIKVLIEWYNGERTWEYLTEFAKDDFETCASYARDEGLLETPGWKRFRNW